MKRLFLSLLTVLTVTALAAGSTLAYWSSTATSADNTFGTGTLQIQLTDVDEPTPSGSVTVSYGETNLAPGDTIPQQVLDIVNNGTLDGNHLDLEVSVTGDTGLAAYINFVGSNGLRFGGDQTGPQSVRFDVPNWTAGDTEYDVTYGLTDLPITGANAVAPRLPGPGCAMDADCNGVVSLADLVALGKMRITPGTVSTGVASGTTAHLWMNTQLDTMTPDAMQGKTVVATFTWTLHQVDSQY